MIPDRIRGLREGLKINQSELARRLGVQRSNVPNWEGGTYSPGMEVLPRLAAILQTSSDYLLGITDDPRPLHELLRLVEGREPTADEALPPWAELRNDQKEILRGVRALLERREVLGVGGQDSSPPASPLGEVIRGASAAKQRREAESPRVHIEGEQAGDDISDSEAMGA